MREIDNWPAERFNTWAEYANSVGGMTPVFLEPLARILYILFLWQGSWSKSEPPAFKELFRWATSEQPEAKEQTPEQMIGLLKAFASVHHPQ